MNKTTFIDQVRIKGFRSLADVELSGIPKAAVLIGANGSGKSNFIRFFEMLSWMLGPRRLGEFVAMQGGADDQLFGGSKRSPEMSATVTMRTTAIDPVTEQTSLVQYDYRISLAHAQPDRLIFAEEVFRRHAEVNWQYLGSGHTEAKIVEEIPPYTPLANYHFTTRFIVSLLRSCSVYQFHDTSDASNFKKRWDVEDNNQLLSHGGNLAAVLHRLEREDIKRFELICKHIGRILPSFDRFVIEESYGKVLLRWKARGMDKTFGAHLTSDGSLRFFALVTLLNLPPEMLPDVLLLDEPELGLHPAAIALIGGMIKALSGERQVIVATQSPLLVDAFDLDEIFVLDIEDGRTEFRKLAQDDYRVWLDENYTSGELWQKNLLGGRP
ncbi:MAG: AAA family ATPase [Gemmatimonadetes bacterium]|nr:AAA family ATPase [Gemmatimonadota bacterium]